MRYFVTLISAGRVPVIRVCELNLIPFHGGGLNQGKCLYTELNFIE